MSLVIENLNSGYGKTPVLHGIEVQAKPGDLIGLVGPNGSGKSCLLKTAAGLIVPSNGHISVFGQSIASLAPKTRAQHITWLAQDRSAVWALPVRELVALGRAPYQGRLGKLSSKDEKMVDEALSSVHCTNLQDRRFDHLSGGEQARILLARALAVGAPLLLADEPTASLDPYFQISIMQSLKNEAKNGKIVLVSLHDLSLAKQFCDRIWVMHHGKLVADDRPNLALDAKITEQVFNVKMGSSGIEPIINLKYTD